MIPLEEAHKTARIIKGKVIRTPLIYSPTLSKRFEASIYLKLENLQKTGSFKIRGAMSKLLTCLKKGPISGAVTASAGNHAQGVALAAKEIGITATIVMPEWTSITKQEATRNYGGEVIIEGRSVAESLEKACELVQEGTIFVHPFDDLDIIKGQGTIGLEIFEDLDDVDMIIVPVGGGGLISGISSVAASVNPKVKVIGVQAASCPSAYESCRQGKVVQVEFQPSIADGICVKQVGKSNFEIIRESVDSVVLVKEEEIASAILLLLERKKTLAEGAGAASLAALLNGSVLVPKGSNVVLIISGGNLDSPFLGRIISQGLQKNGRIMRLRVLLEDTPGFLARLLDLLASLKANVLQVNHARNVGNMPIYTARVDLELETRSSSHVEEITGELQKSGYTIEAN